MSGYVDEKVAKVTLDNKGFSKNAWTKQRPKSSAPNYGDKLKDISKNLSKSQQKVKKQGDAINKANDDALNLLKNLMK